MLGNTARDGLGIKEKYGSWIVTWYFIVFIAIINGIRPPPHYTF